MDEEIRVPTRLDLGGGIGRLSVEWSGVVEVAQKTLWVDAGRTKQFR